MENQEKILHTGLEFFAERGYDAVGVQEIVDAAGITKPTLYYYFGNKEGLLESILSNNFSFLFDQLEKSAIYHGDVKNTLEDITRTYFSFADSHFTFYRFQLSCWFSPPQSAAFRAITNYGQKQQDILEVVFQQAAKDHGNMLGRHQRYAASFFGIINTYIGLKISSQLELDETIVRNTVHQFMHGIFS
ncbi:MAG: TetR/AcrR family transcriptional regulator [Anaerolineaceae bacterium]